MKISDKNFREMMNKRSFDQIFLSGFFVLSCVSGLEIKVEVYSHYFETFWRSCVLSGGYWKWGIQEIC
ncbi:hypothetical protein AKG37_09025 [Bacillus australimaris]|uniref:Lipoprotein n=1 Tax=Bacillus australimaris TaxID=1326968 RepID=A0ABR5MU11_9BACI|nr:hypothetical protein AKG37_09025 [Bacillus australimaris]